jgi:hypothetical protein
MELAQEPVVTAPEAPAVEATTPPVEGKPARDPSTVYSQAEMDRIVEKAKKNAAYRTRKEIEAYYQGRESASAPKQEQKAPEAPKAAEPPKREQFNDYEQFVEAKATFAAEQAVERREAKAQQEREATEAKQKEAEAVKSFQSKAREKYPDIDTRLSAIGEIELVPEVQSEITKSPIGPDILIWLADNPKECERIAALSPSAGQREIVKLEARLEGTTAAPEKPTLKPSKAPEPISPVGGRGAGGDEAPKGTDSGDAYRLKRQQELRARKGQRMGTH